MSTEEFTNLPFVEKKAMLDYADSQRLSFEDEYNSARAGGDREKAAGIREALNRWAGYANALSAECELHIQDALGGEDFTSPV